MTEEEMMTKACHRTHRGEAISGTGFSPPDTFMPRPALCLGSECMAFRANGNACYCADLKKDN